MLNIAILILQLSIGRMKEIRRDERGASAIEWAVIAAIAIVAASAIGAVVYNIVTGRAQNIQDCADTAAGGTSCAPAK